MIFDSVRENAGLINRLENAVKCGRVSHAYIFEGDYRIDKRAFAKAFIKGILCPDSLGENCGKCGICTRIDHDSHEDIIYVEAEGASVKDAQIMQLQERLKTKAFHDRNVAVIEDSDTMTLRAQNRLLKTLEEPPGDTVIILLSENMENLTQTIQSRCVKYKINYFDECSEDDALIKAKNVADMAIRHEPFYILKTEAEKIAKDSDETHRFLDSLQVVYRNMLVESERGIPLLSQEEMAANIHAVEMARKDIRQGVTPVYAIKKLFLKIGG